MSSGDEYAIETVRGSLDGSRAEQVMAFWARRGAMSEAEGARRLRQVVCVLVDGSGEIVGVNSAFPQSVELIAGREFWIYRSLLDQDVPPEAGDRMLAAAFSALEAEFDPAAPGPLGICLLIGNREEMDRRPEAEWREPRMFYAGHLPDGRQARIGYFSGAKIGPGGDGSGSMVDPDPGLAPGYRITPFAETDAVSGQDVIDLWLREGALPAAEAARRIGEVLLVALDDSGSLAGLTSAYLRHNAQLNMDLWYYRAFVATAHRRGNLAVQLALRGRDHLEARYVSGEDKRGPGGVYEVENEGLKRYFNDAIWFPTDFTFIGENARGDHVRVRYFPGARAPGPTAAGR